MGYLKRSVFNGIFSFKFLFGIIALLLVMTFGLYASNKDYFSEGIKINYVVAFLSGYNGWGAVLSMTAPLVATIPFATKHIENRKSGLTKIFVSKMGKDKYFNNLFITNLILTFLQFVIGMFVFLGICFLLFNKSASFDDVISSQGSTIYEVFASKSAILYIMIIILHCSVVSMIFSAFGMACSYFIKNKFVAWISSFIATIIFSFFAIFLNLTQLEPMSIFDVSRVSHMKIYIVVAYVIVVIAFSYIFSKLKFNRDMLRDEEM